MWSSDFLQSQPVSPVQGFAISVYFASSSEFVSIPYEKTFAEIFTAIGFWLQFESYLFLVHVNLEGKGMVRVSFQILCYESQLGNWKGMMLTCRVDAYTLVGHE